jgi:sulfur-carrier protein adenylyltransferase/sulfurtransferase
MNNGKLILAAFILPFAFMVAFFSNHTKDNNATKYAKLLQDVNTKTAYISTDEIVDLIVNKDPSIQLIDVRNQSEFEKFHLPNALNIPLTDLYNEKWDEIFLQDVKKNVFYSNGTVDANSAWMLLKLKGIENIFVMKGGANYWYETQLKPIKPSDLSDNEEMTKYDFRLATSQFLTGAGQTASPAEAAGDKAKTAPSAGGAKPKKKRAGGGC